MANQDHVGSATPYSQQQAPYQPPRQTSLSSTNGIIQRSQQDPQPQQQLVNNNNISFSPGWNAISAVIAPGSSNVLKSQQNSASWSSYDAPQNSFSIPAQAGGRGGNDGGGAGSSGTSSSISGNAVGLVNHGDTHRTSSFNPSSVPPPSIPCNGFNPAGGGLIYRPPDPVTISPQALNHINIPVVRQPGSNLSVNQNASPTIGQSQRLSHNNLLDYVQEWRQSGHFSIVDHASLIEATKSTHLHSFVTVGKAPYDLPITKASVPNYVPRKSRKEIKRLASINGKALTIINTKSGRRLDANGLRALARSNGSIGLQPQPEDSSSSSGDSEYESTSDSELEIIEKSPLPLTRPTTALGAVKYDVVKALWMPKSHNLTANEIRSGLASYWEVVKTIRDRWKTDGKAVTEAEEAKKAGEVPLLKDRVVNQRQMMEVALSAALEYGNKNIIGLLGENASFIFILYQFIADRLRDGDFGGRLVITSLKLLLQCKTLTGETLKKTKASNALGLLVKRGTEETKALSKQITDKVCEYDRKKLESGLPGQKSEAAVTATLNETKTGDAAGRKADEGDNQANKNILPTTQQAKLQGATKSTSLNAKRTEQGVVTKLAALDPSNRTKARGNQVLAKPSNFFAALKSAAKKPGTSLADRAVDSSKSPPTAANPIESGELAQPESVVTNSSSERKNGPTSIPAAGAKSVMSFSQMMADVTKPKEAESKAAERQRSPETQEQRAKRLRKESRRNLRVTFKPDDSLVTIKYFTQDPAEIIGRDLVDAGDVVGEGMVFKSHLNMLDMEEEEDLPREEALSEWRRPSVIDFSDLGAKERKINYVKFGGVSKEPESREKEAQRIRESGSLLVFYSDPSEIPFSPKEPLHNEPLDSKKPIDFGQPTDSAILARMAATRAVPASATPDISALLGFLNSAKPNSQTQPKTTNPPLIPALAGILNSYGTSSQQNPVSGLAQSLASLIPSQSLTPAMAATAPAVASTTAPNTDFQAILAALGSQSAQLSGKPSQIQAPQASMTPALQAQGPNLGAILASLNQPAPALQSTAQSKNQVSEPAEDPDIYEDPARKRQREIAAAEEVEPENAKRRKWNPKGKNPGNWNKPQFVLPCKYFQEGLCVKGSQCTYVHEK